MAGKKLSYKIHPCFNQQMIEIVLELHVFFQNEKKVSAWLTTKNPNFGMIEPAALICNGRGHKVLQFIRDARQGNIP